MGVSTDAMLVYGYVWDDEHDLFRSSDDEEDDDEEEEEEEWEEIIAAQRGIINPWAQHAEELAAMERLPYSEQERQGKIWTDEHRAELDAWYAAKTAIADEYGVEIDRHGSRQWTVPVVKIAGAGHIAARGYPHQLAAADLAADPSWDGKLTRFAYDLGIDLSEAQGPGWFLASWWG